MLLTTGRAPPSLCVSAPLRLCVKFFLRNSDFQTSMLRAEFGRKLFRKIFNAKTQRRKDAKKCHKTMASPSQALRLCFLATIPLCFSRDARESLTSYIRQNISQVIFAGAVSS